MSRSVGRPPKYKPKYAKAIIEFFSVPAFQSVLKKEIIKSNGTVEREYIQMAADLPTLERFAWSIGVDDKTLQRWSERTVSKTSKKLKYPEFCLAYNKAKQLQKEWLMSVGLKGLAPPASFIFTAKNITNMRDKQEIDHSTLGKPISVGVVSYADAAKLLAEKKKNE